jgi:hypothetical protein
MQQMTQNTNTISVDRDYHEALVAAALHTNGEGQRAEMPADKAKRELERAGLL